MARSYRETFVIEQPAITRDAAGGPVESWTTFVTVRGDYTATSYQEQARRGQMGGGLQATITILRVSGVTGAMRLRWKSNADRLLYISSVVPKGDDDRYLELTVEEKAT